MMCSTTHDFLRFLLTTLLTIVVVGVLPALVTRSLRYLGALGECAVWIAACQVGGVIALWMRQQHGVNVSAVSCTSVSSV